MKPFTHRTTRQLRKKARRYGEWPAFCIVFMRETRHDIRRLKRQPGFDRSLYRKVRKDNFRWRMK